MSFPAPLLTTATLAVNPSPAPTSGGQGWISSNVNELMLLVTAIAAVIAIFAYIQSRRIGRRENEISAKDLEESIESNRIAKESHELAVQQAQQLAELGTKEQAQNQRLKVSIRDQLAAVLDRAIHNAESSKGWIVSPGLANLKSELDELVEKLPPAYGELKAELQLVLKDELSNQPSRILSTDLAARYKTVKSKIEAVFSNHVSS